MSPVGRGTCWSERARSMKPRTRPLPPRRPARNRASSRAVAHNLGSETLSPPRAPHDQRLELPRRLDSCASAAAAARPAKPAHARGFARLRGSVFAAGSSAPRRPLPTTAWVRVELHCTRDREMTGPLRRGARRLFSYSPFIRLTCYPNFRGEVVHGDGHRPGWAAA